MHKTAKIFILFSKLILLFNLIIARLRCFVLLLLCPATFRRLSSTASFHGFPRIGRFFRHIYIGKNVSIGRHIYLLSNGGPIDIGNNVRINDYCFITAICGIEIGKKTLIAEFVSIRDYDHQFSDLSIPISKQGFNGKPIVIGENVWIGRGVCILKGVKIGDNAIIGANSTVTKDIPANTVAFGSPAKVHYVRN
jgi:acetyltransferase-like isoleucine patch superfamily enzyme